MSQKVIKTNQSIVPFFGERMSFIRGLDPLGLQNTSDAAFSFLLPGLNNVTGRVRYYSFYCWLLDEYSKRNGSTDPAIQRKFIRTAEYIIALSSQFYKEGNGSIPGSNYAKSEVQNTDIQTHDLNDGIYKSDGSTAGTYWNFRWGAFGQYYLGSLRDIGIVIDRDLNGGVYTRTNSKENAFVSGEILASAFEQNIPFSKKELFFSCLNKGSITEKQAQDLLPEFNLTQVPQGTEEQVKLTELLLQKDYPLRIEEEPVTLRKETIYHLLNFVELEPEKFSDRQFVYYTYDKKGRVNGVRDSSLFGWYYYQFNEFWHYANTSILNGTLDYLEGTYGPNWVELSLFLGNIANLVFEKFSHNGLVRQREDKLSLVIANLDASEHHFLRRASESSKIDRVFYGFLLFFSEFKNNNNELAALKEYGENNNLAKDGEGSGYLMMEFNSKLNEPLLEFIREYIFKRIIYRHQYVAFRKMRGGNLSTQKVIVEDHHIRYLGNFEPSFTGPRIGSLIAFLKDLKIITEENKLSEYGSRILLQLTPTDDQ